MKNFRLYTLIIILLLATSACKKAEPRVPVAPKQEPVEAPAPQPVKQKESDFVQENYIAEDEHTKIFRDCYETGEIKLSQKCHKEINSFIKKTSLREKRSILIEVHTDKGGDAKNNLAISKKRAYGVASSLYYKEYKYSKVYYKGFGEQKPLYDSQTSKANMQNRRIVVRLQDKTVKVDRKVYTLYVKAKKQATRKSKKRKTDAKSVQKLKKVDLKKYTGKADIGWIYFGPEKLKKKFEISCAEDKPRKVKRRTIKGHNQKEFISGIYKKTYSAKYDKSAFIISPVSIYDDGYLAEHNPNIVLTNPNKSKTIITTIVNSYNGEKGILYRVFVNKKNSAKNSMECMDLMIPYKSGELEYGVVYFRENNQLVARELK